VLLLVQVGAAAAPSLPPLVDTTETPQPGNVSQSPPPEDQQLPSLEPLGASSLTVPSAETAALIEQQIKAAHVEAEVGAAEPGMEQGPADVASGEEVAADVAEIGAEQARGEAGKGSEKVGAPGGEKGGDGIAEPDMEQGPSDAALGSGGKEQAGADMAKTGPEVALADKKEALAGPESVGTSGVAAKGIAERNSDGDGRKTGASRGEAATRAGELDHDIENAAGEGRVIAGEESTGTGPTVKGTAELGPIDGVDSASQETAGAEEVFPVAAGVEGAKVDSAEAKGGAEGARGSGGAAVACAIAVREDVRRQGPRKGVAEGAVSGGTEERNADEPEPESEAEGAGMTGEEKKEAKEQERKSSGETEGEPEGQAKPEPCGGEGKADANPDDAPAETERSRERTAGSDQEDAPADRLVGQERRLEPDSDDGETKKEAGAGCAGEKTEVRREDAEAEQLDLQNEPSVSKEADFPLEDAPSETGEPDAVKLEKEGPEGLEGTPGEGSRGPQSAEQIEELGPGRELGEGARKDQGGATEAEPVSLGAGEGEKQVPEREEAEPDSDEPEGRRGPHSDKPENEAPLQLGEGPGTWPAGGAGGDTCQEGGGSGGDLIIAPEAEVNDAWEHLPSGSTGAKTRSLSGDYWPGELVNGIPGEAAGGLDGWQERALTAEREVERLRKEAQGAEENSERAWGNRLECCTSRWGGGHVAETIELREKVQMMSEHVEWMREEIARLRGALEAQALCGVCGACVNPKPRAIENNGSQGRGCEPEPFVEAMALLGRAAGPAGPSKLPLEASAAVETSRGNYSDVRAADFPQYVLRKTRGLTSENGGGAERAGEASEMMRRGAVGASARLAGYNVR
jgi:hypothetical protein